MAENNQNEVKIFNWAKESQNDANLKQIYHDVWVHLVGSEAGFNEFYNECLSGRIGEKQEPVSGTSFQERLLQEMKEHNPEAYEAAGSEKQFIKNKCAEALKKVHEAQAEAEAKAKANNEPAKKEVSNIETGIESYLGQAATNGYLSYDTGVAAGKEMGDGKNANVECGGGKTSICITATNHAVKNNCQVFLTSSTENLSTQSFNESIASFEAMEITSVVLIRRDAILYPGKEPITKEKCTPEQWKEALRVAYSQKVVMADNGTILQHKMAGMIPEKDADFSERRLIADEGDYVKLDQYHAAEMLGDEYDQETAIARLQSRKVAYELIQELKSHHSDASALYQANDENGYVDYTKAGREFIASRIRELAAKDPTLNAQQLSEFAYDALKVEILYQKDRDYQIVVDENHATIVSPERASGASIDLPQGVQQALYVKLRKDYGKRLVRPQERQVLKSMTITTAYKELFGDHQQLLSGTLDSPSKQTQDELEKMGVTKNTTYYCDTLHGCKLQEQPTRLYRTNDEMFKGAIDEAVATAKPDGQEHRPVLINTVNAEDVYKIRNQLRTEHPDIRVVTYTLAESESFKQAQREIEKETNEERKAALSAAFEKKFDVKPGVFKSYDEFIKKTAGQPGTVIVGNGIVGRGTNIKLLGDANENGGLHVIIAGAGACSSRDDEQIKHRASRGQDNGSSRSTLSLENLSPEMLARLEKGEFTGNEPFDLQTGDLSKVDAETLLAAHYEEVDARQTIVRGNENAIDQMRQDAMKSIEERIKTQLQGKPEAEISQRIVTAQALLNYRVDTIKNRASGNILGSQHAEYAAEVRAFEMLYTQQYISEDPSKFDEKAAMRDIESILPSVMGAEQDGNSQTYTEEQLRSLENLGLADTYFEFSQSQIEAIVTHFQGKSVGRETLQQMVVDSGLTQDATRKIMQQLSGQPVQEQTARKQHQDQIVRE